MRFIVKRARRGRLHRNQWCFVMVADNGEVVATSETYANKLDAEMTVELIRAHAQQATILTEET